MSYIEKNRDVFMDFLYLYQDNRRFRELVEEACFDKWDFWYSKEYGRDDEEAVDRSFEKLASFNLKLLASDPFDCVSSYARRNACQTT